MSNHKTYLPVWPPVSTEPATKALKAKRRVAHFANLASRVMAESKGLSAVKFAKIEPKRVSAVTIYHSMSASLLNYLRHQNWLDQTGKRERKAS